MTDKQQLKTVLAVHAHPDDTELFCSGTLFLLKQAGCRIIIVTMTNGELGSYSEDRQDAAKTRFREACNAADFLGADYHCMNRHDGFLFDSPDIRTDFIEILRRYNADIILTHRYDDYHPDHRATSEIVEAAAILSALPNIKTESSPLRIAPLFYRTDTLHSKNRMGDEYLKPHFYIDITSEMDNKTRMLSYHESQKELMTKMHNIGDFFAEMKSHDSYNGNSAGVAYAEAFWQHTGGGFQNEKFIQNTLEKYHIGGKP